jgi:glucose/arabinose dehydrogenase
MIRRMNSMTGRSLIVCVLLSGCSSVAPTVATRSTGSTPASPPAGPSGVSVQVPASMRTPPFDITRTLTIPAGYTIAVYARVDSARFLAVTPDSNLLVSVPTEGKITLIRPNSTGDPVVTDFATGLTKPQGMAFHTIGSTTYLYVAESDQIDRYTYAAGDLTAQGRQIIISGLPDYGHAVKSIALDASNNLYVSLPSSCNVCTSDLESSPIRGSIYLYGADGSNGRLFAEGIRNAEGLAILPGATTLWVAVNNRDSIPYPYQDSTGQYGQVVQSYVDNHPPEELMPVRDGGNYGWPYCNPTQDSPAGYNDMPFDRAYDMNADGHVDCSTMDTIVKGFQAHSAPLGLTFLQGSRAPVAYQGGAVIAFHGSWNRSTKTGYKVVYMPFAGSLPVSSAPTDLVAGWTDGTTEWGRPVDVVVDSLGSFFISDDYSGTIYKLTASAPSG